MSQLFFLERFEHRERGRATRQVICEKCSCRYQYTLARTVRGRAVSPLGFQKSAAELRAQRAARRRLDRVLRTAANPVTCPKCGRLQADMVRELRRSRQRIFTPVPTSVLVSALLILALGLVRLRVSGDHSSQHWHELLFWCGVPALLAGVSLLARWMLSDDSGAAWLGQDGASI